MAYLFYSVIGLISSFANRIKDNDFYINFACAKCISFWGTLIWCGDLQSALLVSLSVLLLDSFIVTKL